MEATMDERYVFHDITLSVLTQPKSDVHALFVWPAALHLCRFIADNRQMFNGKRVVELGAGVGLCGILLAKCSSPSSLLITDGEPEAIGVLDENIKRNLIDLGVIQQKAVSTLCLEWGGRNQLVDHNLYEKTDVIIGSDLAFDDGVTSLFKTVHFMMSDHNSRFILSYHHRDEYTYTLMMKIAKMCGLTMKIMLSDGDISILMFSPS